VRAVATQSKRRRARVVELANGEVKNLGERRCVIKRQEVLLYRLHVQPRREKAVVLGRSARQSVRRACIQAPRS
jgi:hypothetical protein